MNKRTLRIFAAGAAVAALALAQNQRQATMVGGGSPDRGKCTIEVVVDGVAQVEIRGSAASLRTMSGQPAQFRRFECTGAMPAAPGNFRFSGVDGRGRQTLVSDPRNGGAAVIQIEDKDGGAEGYTFDITWEGRGMNGGNPNSAVVPGGGQQNSGQPNYQDRNRSNPNGGNNPMYGGNQPNNQGDQRGVGNPQVYGGNQPNYQGEQRGTGNQQAYGRNQPNYQDREQRDAGVRQDNDRRDSGGYRYEERYRPDYRDSDYFRRYGHGFGVEEAVRVCQQAVSTQAARRFRTSDIHFHRTAIDDNAGRQDWVTGTLDVHQGQREQRFGFSCSVNFDNGRVRSASLDARPLADDPRWH